LGASMQSASDGGTDTYAYAYITLSVLLLSLLIRARMDAKKHPEARWRPAVCAYLDPYILLQAIGVGVWIASLAFDEPARYILWGLGIGVQMCGPLIGLRHIWQDDHAHDRLFHFEHIRVRYGLLTIIVLGESILAISLGKLNFDATTMVTASLAFLIAVSIWWIYFDRSGRAALSGNIGVSFLWGYGHFVIFAGVAAVGVGAQLIIEAAAAGSGAGAGPAVIAGGLVAFLGAMTLINLSNVGFRITRIGRFTLPLRLLVAAALVAVAWFATPSPLAFAAIAGISMLLLNVVEATIARRLWSGRARTAG
ncbi:MAG: low temperature requirement protein A, partial [Solirubrobacterales bacterium]